KELNSVDHNIGRTSIHTLTVFIRVSIRRASGTLRAELSRGSRRRPAQLIRIVRCTRLEHPLQMRSIALLIVMKSEHPATLTPIQRVVLHRVAQRSVELHVIDDGA